MNNSNRLELLIQNAHKPIKHKNAQIRLTKQTPSAQSFHTQNTIKRYSCESVFAMI